MGHYFLDIEYVKGLSGFGWEDHLGTIVYLFLLISLCFSFYLKFIASSSNPLSAVSHLISKIQITDFSLGHPVPGKQQQQEYTMADEIPIIQYRATE